MNQGRTMRTDIAALRDQIQADGNFSNTTMAFQDDLLRYGEEFASRGNCFIEVGCLRGGMTAQLAALARDLGQKVHAIDIDPGFLSVARDTVAATVGEGHAEFHHMDFTRFVAEAGPEIRPSLVLIDGDHFYDGVVADIVALFAMKSVPYAAAFHDYSLRYSHPEGAGVRVDLALHDTLGRGFEHVPLGEVARDGGALRTIPGPDHHFHELGKSEGVLIMCERHRLRQPGSAPA